MNDRGVMLAVESKTASTTNLPEPMGKILSKSELLNEIDVEMQILANPLSRLTPHRAQFKNS